jgi:hypothetical protein
MGVPRAPKRCAGTPRQESAEVRNDQGGGARPS